MLQDNIWKERDLGANLACGLQVLPIFKGKECNLDEGSSLVQGASSENFAGKTEILQQETLTVQVV